MDYIHSFLIAGDDFDENTGDLDQQKSGQVGKQQEGLPEKGYGKGSQASQPQCTTSTVEGPSLVCMLELQAHASRY